MYTSFKILAYSVKCNQTIKGLWFNIEISKIAGIA